jgi:hypothetical protein
VADSASVDPGRPVVARLKVRTLGSGRTHYADIPAMLIRESTVHGRACRTVAPPVAALCGAVLGARGPATVVVMRDSVAVGCSGCVSIAARVQSPNPTTNGASTP